MDIEGYSDVDWAGCLDDMRFTSYYVFIRENLVSWKSRKAKCCGKV